MWLWLENGFANIWGPGAGSSKPLPFCLQFSLGRQKRLWELRRKQESLLEGDDVWISAERCLAFAHLCLNPFNTLFSSDLGSCTCSHDPNLRIHTERLFVSLINVAANKHSKLPFLFIKKNNSTFGSFSAQECFKQGKENNCAKFLNCLLAGLPTCKGLGITQPSAFPPDCKYLQRAIRLSQKKVREIGRPGFQKQRNSLLVFFKKNIFLFDDNSIKPAKAPPLFFSHSNSFWSFSFQSCLNWLRCSRSWESSLRPSCDGRCSSGKVQQRGKKWGGGAGFGLGLSCSWQPPALTASQAPGESLPLIQWRGTAG